MKSGQLLGAALLGLGLLVGLGCGGWLVVSATQPGFGLSGGAAVLLGILIVVFVVILIGVGGYLFSKGRREEATAATEQAAGVKQRQMMDIVKTRAQIPISDLVFELKANRDDVQRWIHDLVGMGIFSGYVNWDEGILYSMEASKLRDMTRCKHCGGEVQLAGKGVVRCPFCGTEYFLP